MTKLAVHLHLYYMAQLPEILEYLKSLEGVDYDLYVTMTAPHPQAAGKIRQAHPQAVIWQAENRGYDVGPFIDFLHHIDLDAYEYVLKLHTKGKTSNNYTLLNGNRLNNALWGQILWDSLLKNQTQLAENLKRLDDSAAAGMLGSKYCLTGARQDYEKLLPRLKEELKKMGLPAADKLMFVAGTMFLVRANLLKPLSIYRPEDFAPTDGRIKEGTLAHVFERLFGAVVLGQNQQILPINHQGYFFRFILAAAKRFFYQKKLTPNRRLIIKICKIPVFYKQL